MAKAAKQDEQEQKPVKYIVAQPFRNINDFNEIYKAGDDVSHFTEARLEPLIAMGIVKQAK